MVECVCPKCKAKLRIDENDAIPGCREFEEMTQFRAAENLKKCIVQNVRLRSQKYLPVAFQP